MLLQENAQSTAIFYPDTDGEPMTESDATRDYLLYCVEVLGLYFRGRRNVYVSGNLFVYSAWSSPRTNCGNACHSPGSRESKLLAKIVLTKIVKV